jgi:hypothetical protein
MTPRSHTKDMYYRHSLVVFMLAEKIDVTRFSFVASVSLMALIFAIGQYQLQYANGISSSSTICINGKCVTKVCPENESCRAIGDNSTGISNDNSTRKGNNTSSSIPLRII